MNKRKIEEWNSGSGMRMKGKSPPERSHFTIMISRGPAKVRSFRISSKALISCVLFSGLFFLGSLLCFYLYMDTRRAGKIQKAPVEEPRETFRNVTDEKARAENPPELTKKSDYSKSDGFAKDKIETETSVIAGEEPEKSLVTATTSGVSESPVPEEEKVGIEKIVISREGEKLLVQFRVTNENPSRQRIGGYLFAIAVGEEDQPGFWSYPKTPLQDGVPFQYKQGQPFRIMNYKDIRGACLLESQDTAIRSIKILVYNEMGKCILTREVAADSSMTDGSEG